MKKAFTYGTTDPRFGVDEVLTIKQIIMRYRVNKWDVSKDGTKMSIHDIMIDTINNGAFCLDQKGET